mmetsp:Transcript_32767/g.55245  ORF Transcript_32767/g.55245 Transcript_32767/m.55245 type:complete len:392 (+) Transcript_32767:47-1222(+)|eukprot:CAMPEP_0174968850 /NCGR_PEP_ID=MMETSP0004_2-20121128/8387_1 /TAXON_ID=420556 /ORGANISM="Ochromonas sp., Strain CCMP1393" /LENGTH=391 /DNA_ID=CAMNT_0016218177 /DNA_START=27 /DNA_END=1202 /DNA_ORIENTATION=-
MSTPSPLKQPVKAELVSAPTVVSAQPVQPAFVGIEAKAVPAEYEGFTPENWGVLDSSQTLQIRQHVKLLPKQCCTCPPCVKQENTYSVYAGRTRDAQAEFLRVDEVSDDWNRCCCSPYHPLRLEVRQYIPIPGDQTNSDMSHLSDDFRSDWGRLTGNDRANALRNLYSSQPPLLSLVRDDGQRCCFKCPCKWLDTFVCFSCCMDGMHIYSGAVEDEPEKEKGRPWNLPADKQLGSVIQPMYGGCCIPVLHLRDAGAADDSEPYAKVEGPCIFGGWSEMCCTFNFYTSRFNSKSKAADLATIAKLKPQSMAGALTELASNSDFYSIDFKEDAGLTVQQKIQVLTAQLFADYMWFDGNTEKCEDRPEAVYCYCFYCSIIGKLIPCYIAIPKNN